MYIILLSTTFKCKQYTFNNNIAQELLHCLIKSYSRQNSESCACFMCGTIQLAGIEQVCKVNKSLVAHRKTNCPNSLSQSFIPSSYGNVNFRSSDVSQRHLHCLYACSRQVTLKIINSHFLSIFSDVLLILNQVQ
jgi:hypothetical protein